jgi:hypothetical protein
MYPPLLLVCIHRLLLVHFPDVHAYALEVTRIVCLPLVRIRHLVLARIYGLLVVRFADVHSQVLQSICRHDPHRISTVRTYASHVPCSLLCTSVGSHW